MFLIGLEIVRRCWYGEGGLESVGGLEALEGPLQDLGGHVRASERFGEHGAKNFQEGTEKDLKERTFYEILKTV